MSYIGHIEARRRKTAEGWQYESPEQQTFAEGLQLIGNLSLPDVDAHIETMEARGEASANDLREYRRQAFKNRSAFDFALRYLERVLVHKMNHQAQAKIHSEKVEKTAALLYAETLRAAAGGKLTAKQKAEIVARRARGENVSALAKAFGVSRRTIDKTIEASNAKAQTANDPFRLAASTKKVRGGRT